MARVVGCRAFRVARVVGCRAWGSRERPEAPPPPGDIRGRDTRGTSTRWRTRAGRTTRRGASRSRAWCRARRRGARPCSRSIFCVEGGREGRTRGGRVRRKRVGTRAMLAPRPRRGGSEARERGGGGGEGAGAGAGAGARRRGDARAEYRGSHLHVMPMARARTPSRDAGVTRASECVVGCAGTRGGSCAAEHSLSLARSEGGESTDV